MSRHATAEVLSAFLDEELDRPEEQRLEDHLATCQRCRHDLGSLRRVVTSVRRLERMAPPPVLAQNVQRHIALSGSPASPLEWMEQRLGRIHSSSSIFFTFALVTTLAVLLYFFAEGVERAGQPRTALVLPPPPALSAPVGEQGEIRVVDGRSFVLMDGLWRQQDLGQRFADFHVEADSAVGREILRRHPELGSLGNRILLRFEEGVVELRGAWRRAQLDALRRDGAERPPDQSE